MSKFLILIPFWSGNSQQAEHLIDFIYQQNGKQAKGDALLIASNEVHAEPREKIKISASLAFEGYEMIQLGKVSGDKATQISATWRAASQYVFENYTIPFLWLEPDCIPTRKGWQDEIANAYSKAIKRYLGNASKRAKLCPNNAALDYAKTINSPATPTDLIVEQMIEKDADIAGIPKSAALVHADKSHILLRSLRSKLK